MTVQVTSATLTPLTIDGGFQITGVAADTVGILYPGERVDLLLSWNKDFNTHPKKINIFLDPEYLRMIPENLETRANT